MGRAGERVQRSPISGHDVSRLHALYVFHSWDLLGGLWSRCCIRKLPLSGGLKARLNILDMGSSFRSDSTGGAPLRGDPLDLTATKANKEKRGGGAVCESSPSEGGKGHAPPLISMENSEAIFLF